MGPISNPHDVYMKNLLGRKEIACDFFRSYLPKDILEEINMDTLKLEKDSFVGNDLKESFSDLLFSAYMGNEKAFFYFLIEHKSYTGGNVVVQLFGYICDIMKSYVKEGKNGLPAVIPIVIYNGNSRWNASGSLGEEIKGYTELPGGIRKMIPDFEYVLVNLSEMDDDELKGDKLLYKAFQFAREIKNGTSKTITACYVESMEILSEMEDQALALEFVDIFTIYFYNGSGNNFTEDDLNEIIEEVQGTYTSGGERIMTLAEQLIENGLAKGKAEGLAKGKAEGLAKGKAEGLAKGKAEGLAKGKAEGLAKGKAEGLAEGVKEIIYIYRNEINLDDDTIRIKLMNKFDITESEANSYLNGSNRGEE